MEQAKKRSLISRSTLRIYSDLWIYDFQVKREMIKTRIEDSLRNYIKSQALLTIQ